MGKVKIDPVCLVHGKKMSEHRCLYCCLCFKSLTPEECNIRADGKKEDVCKACAKMEKKMEVYNRIVLGARKVAKNFGKHESTEAESIIIGSLCDIIGTLQEQRDDLLRALKQIKDHDTHTLYGNGNAKQMALIADEAIAKVEPLQKG